MVLYDESDVDDYEAMMESADMMCQGLRHHVTGRDLLDEGEPIFNGTDNTSETVHCIFIAATARPPDGRTLSDLAQRSLRLALVIAKANTWQSEQLGGNGRLSETFNDRALVAHGEAACRKDLRVFFASGGG
ncbi:MAG: hypothetical protein WEC34_09960 [Acidimicrobiia bacterium]